MSCGSPYLALGLGDLHVERERHDHHVEVVTRRPVLKGREHVIEGRTPAGEVDLFVHKVGVEITSRGQSAAHIFGPPGISLFSQRRLEALTQRATDRSSLPQDLGGDDDPPRGLGVAIPHDVARMGTAKRGAQHQVFVSATMFRQHLKRLHQLLVVSQRIGCGQVLVGLGADLLLDGLLPPLCGRLPCVGESHDVHQSPLRGQRDRLDVVQPATAAYTR